MDAARLRQRSASHSSLRSQYRYQSRMTSYNNPRPSGQRHPLRGVNGHAALLRSPGPLESMLKTTTETGDIGIFSIRPNSSSNFGRPTRSRSHPREAVVPFPPRPSGYDENYYYHPEDHRRMRSYRDTTSEIISLYGSESQQTLFSSVSPASLEDDPRSYSMTTTSSKRIPSQKSTGTLQSQSSGSGYQRPRSPFPYPTRLKRPGVRPASPALRDNGDVDYSRMVELDRFSQRTIHGSYKPSFSQGSRRPLPMAFRPDVNRSTNSLPSRSRHSPYLYAPVPCHAKPSSSSLPWGTPRQSSRHQRVSADQSTRSPSLTSIVEMYDRPTTSNSNCAPSIQSPGPLFYDYSEQFEDEPPWDGEMDVPLHPIPKRAENIRQSLLLMNDIEGNFDLGGNYSDSIKSDAQDAENPSAEPSQSSDAAACNTKEAETKQSASRDERHAIERHSAAQSSPGDVPLITISDEEKSQVQSLQDDASPDMEADATDMLSLVSDSASSRSNSPLETPSKVTETKFDVLSESRSQQPSQDGFSKLRYSLDPALSEFASIVTSFDRLGRVPSANDSEAQSMSGERHDASVYQQGELHPGALKRSSRWPSPTPPQRIEEEGGVYKKRHRRNGAASRISLTGIVPDSYIKRTPQRRNSLQILSPEPISPVRQLRVKESIPQLMKALPPLPREAEKLSGYGTARIPTPCDYLENVPLMLSRDGLAEMKLQLKAKQKIAPPTTPQGPQNTQSRIRVRAYATPSSSLGNFGGAPCSASSERPTFNSTQDYYSSASRSRLRLNASPSQVGQGRPDQSGLSPFNTRLKQCNSLAELTPCIKRGTFNERVEMDRGNKGQVSSFDSSSCNSVAVEGKPIQFEPSPPPSPQPSDQFNIPYPPSPAKAEVHPSAIPPLNSGAVLIQTGDSCVDYQPKGPRGLRNKLSMLRLRFASTQKYNGTILPVIRSEPNTFPSPAITSYQDTNDWYDAGIIRNQEQAAVEPEKVEWRVKRWARDARKAVRLYVKRTLERSPRASA
ncbi:hypothetical protein BBK36DRAFT_5849 [Trichoderma citrinoviride]|uniref:Uncharacterized protein n=1 Tax=Trichoderma citrinoviride TaxID=58853 RepID=A0A2T4B7U5_9HYPO|nr:hypothetical protein BBK36DRAFT_5849 [Trichoderma citrinoviride]PTB65404.1 hypothetical protein BBK36DRAFT_5849 [Trichoderma citrinoviride]